MKNLKKLQIIKFYLYNFFTSQKKMPLFLFIIIYDIAYGVYSQFCINLVIINQKSSYEAGIIGYYTNNLITYSSNFIANADFPKNWQYTFTKPGSLGAESIQIFHSDLWLVLGIIFCTVLYVGIESIIRFRASKNKKTKAFLSTDKKAKLIEFFWTIMPLLIVCIIIIPSIALTSTLEPSSNISEQMISKELENNKEKSRELPTLSINVTGNQWYWQYQIHLSDIKEFLGLPKEFVEAYAKYFEEPVTVDAYMIPELDLKSGDLRGLSATKKLVLPEGFEIRLTGNSRDVIHSWGVAGLDTKMDVTPGRSTMEILITTTPGEFKGQCSEICGAFHGQMPIDIQVLPLEDFADWTKKLVSKRAAQDGLSGIYKYLKGDYGTSTYLFHRFPEILGPLKLNDFHGHKCDEIYTKQAKILHRFRLKNQFLEYLGFSVNHDESHLFLDLKHPIRDFSPDGDPTYAIKVDDEMYHNWLIENKKRYFEDVWFNPNQPTFEHMSPQERAHFQAERRDMYQDYIHTTVRPFESSKTQFPWKRGELPYKEPNYISHDYAITLPHAMSFVSCHNQWYGPNFTSYDNTEGNVWYFGWYTSSLWIDDIEYRHLYDFPQPWGFNNEPVLPVVPKVYIGDSGFSRSNEKLGQELGYRFLTKKVRCPWATGEVDTVLVQSFNGHLYDTGVPINEIWCAKFRFVTMPPLKYIGTRNFSA